MKYDFIIVGSGIVGLATARRLQQVKENTHILLLEKENSPARHQTGHNSGVIHAGVYYEPGSLKARFCREGAAATYAFCRDYGIPHRQTGKLIVATNPSELDRLGPLLERCVDNGLNPEMLDQAGLRELEPAVKGAAAIRVQESGIVDYPAMCNEMLRQFCECGGHYLTGCEVTGITEHSLEVLVHSRTGTFTGNKLVVCAGLMADRLARMQGLDEGFRIIPYRGEYFRLRPALDGLISHLVYPVPDPTLPFLGVHLTPQTDGSITVGPNAVQGWKREGYGRFNFSARDTLEMLSFAGFWRASLRHFRHGLRETRNSLWKKAYVAEVQKYCPQIKSADLLPHPAGIRAQAVTGEGVLLHDFLLKQTARCLHVCNAPSPAATSAIPIGRHICERLAGAEGAGREARLLN